MTRLADVNSFNAMFTSLILKTLLILRLRAIWNKNFIGKRTGNRLKSGVYLLNIWILVTLILYFMMAGMFENFMLSIDHMRKMIFTVCLSTHKCKQ